MPTTINGIGTHYYGTKNRQTRPGICESCGREAELSSYDTRLWFVIVFVPVIPLGRKRIIDQCSHCLRHRVTSQHDWETLSQLNISGAMEKYTSNPSVETALETHATLLSFRKMDEAAKFRGAFQERYSDNATLYSGLAIQLCAMGQIEQALPLFEKAHALNPELPEARLGVAQFRITQGRLDEARQLLQFLEQPGAAQTHSLEPLEELAQAYQKLGRHADALALSKRLLEELPHIGEIHSFRKFVGTSERALGATESMLPERSFSLRRFLDSKSGAYPKWQRNLGIAGVVALLLTVGLAIHNEYIRRNRTVHVLNAFPKAAQVAIDDETPLDVRQKGTVTVSEGKHRVQISGPIEENFEIDVSSGYSARWRNSPAWVINVGGAAALAYSRVIYAADPQPAEIQMLFGDRFLAFPNVDYLFVEPPEQISVDSNKTRVVKTHLEQSIFPPVLVFLHALDNGEADKAMTFAECHLLARPEEQGLLTAYLNHAKSSGQIKRAEEILKRGCKARPVSVAWHREYQSLDTSVEREAALIAEYDAALREDPDNAALSFLRGRISPNRAESVRFFEKATKNDPKLGWPWFGMALNAASHRDWSGALQHVHQLNKATDQSPEWVRLIHEVRIAAGEAQLLETEYQEQVESNAETTAVMFLCDALMAQGKTETARQTLDKWLQSVPVEYRENNDVQNIYRFCLYTIGDLNELTRKFGEDSANQSGQLWMETLNALGRPAEAVKLPSFSKEGLQNSQLPLELCVAFAMVNDQAAAAEWRNLTCANLEKLGSEGRTLASILRGNEPPTKAQFDEAIYHPGPKALLAIVLAQRFPERKDEFLEYARQFCVSRLPPYLLVQKAMESLK